MTTKKAMGKPSEKQGGKTATKSQKTQAPKEQGKQTEAANKIAITARIDKIIDKPDSNLKAIASISMGDDYAVHGFRILESQNGLFISMPNTSYTDREGKTQYNDTFHPVTMESREYLIQEIKQAYEQALESKQGTEQESEQNEIPFEGPAL